MNKKYTIQDFIYHLSWVLIVFLLFCLVYQNMPKNIHPGNKDLRLERGDPNVLYAASIGDLETLKTLQENGISLQGTDEAGNTVLHLAAQKGNFESFLWLVENSGVDINSINRHGYTVKDMVMWNGDIYDYLDSHGARHSWRGWLQHLFI